MVRTLKFEDLNLGPEVLNGLRDIQYDEPTSLHKSVIPSLLEGKNVLLKADPGRDKQGAIVIPALEKYSQIEEYKGTHILIITPHANEVQQLDELIRTVGYHTEIECAAVDAEGDPEEQKKAVTDGVPVLIANPGRLLEILQDNLFIFRHLDYLVIDNVQELVSMDMITDVKNICKRVISKPQKLLLTSDLTKEAGDLAKTLLHEPAVIGFDTISANGQALKEAPPIPKNLSQGYIYVPSRMKISTLLAHIESNPSDTCVIFTASKRGTDRLYRILRKRGLKATSLHGKLSEEKKAQRFANFSNGDVQYLLVADIPAASLEIEKVTQVINYDVPGDPDEYRYRANMVGSGKATRIVSLVSKQDRNDINELQNELGQAPKELPLPDEVQKKLKQRKNKDIRGRGRTNKKGSRSGRKSNRNKPKKKMELPRPSYDKLSGGRSGHSNKQSGVLGFFKKLFS